jgi:hypothetical protein
MEGRSGHVAAVRAAIAQVDELQNAIRLAQDRYPETLDLTIHATGEDPVTDAGTAAMEAVVVLALRIGDLYDLCEVAKSRLATYGITF